MKREHLAIPFTIALLVFVLPLPVATQQVGTAEIHGRVTTKDSGAPIAAADVEIVSVLSSSSRTLPLRRTTRTAADGSYTVSDLPPGPYSISVVTRGYFSGAC